MGNWCCAPAPLTTSESLCLVNKTNGGRRRGRGRYSRMQHERVQSNEDDTEPSVTPIPKPTQKEDVKRPTFKTQGDAAKQEDDAKQGGERPAFQEIPNPITFVAQRIRTTDFVKSVVVGPVTIEYFEVVSRRRNDVRRRHFWFFGEYHDMIHLCVPRDSTMSFPDYVRRLIHDNQEFGPTWDIFIEQYYTKKERVAVDCKGEDDVPGLVSIRECSFESCLRTNKAQCPYNRDARFHYTDVRVKELDVFARIEHWLHQTAEQDAAMEWEGLDIKQFRRNPRAYILGSTPTWLEMSRVMRQRTKLKHDRGLQRAISTYFDTRRVEELARISSSDTLSVRVTNIRAIMLYMCTFPDEYTMLRMMRRFDTDPIPRRQFVTNALSYDGFMHTGDKSKCLRALAQQRVFTIESHIRFGIDSTQPQYETNGKCCFFNPALCRVVVPRARTTTEWPKDKDKEYIVSLTTPLSIPRCILRDISSIYRLVCTQFDPQGFPTTIRHVFLFERTPASSTDVAVYPWEEELEPTIVALDPEDLESHLNPGVMFAEQAEEDMFNQECSIVLTSYPMNELHQFQEWAVPRRILVCVDDVYGGDGTKHSTAIHDEEIGPEVHEYGSSHDEWQSDKWDATLYLAPLPRVNTGGFAPR